MKLRDRLTHDVVVDVGLCPDWPQFNPKNAVDNAKKAMDAAEKWMDVPQVTCLLTYTSRRLYMPPSSLTPLLFLNLYTGSVDFEPLVQNQSAY